MAKATTTVNIEAALKKVSPTEAYAIGRLITHATWYVRKGGARFRKEFAAMKEAEIVQSLISTEEGLAAIEASYQEQLEQKEKERDIRRAANSAQKKAEKLARRACAGYKVDLALEDEAVRKAYPQELEIAKIRLGLN